MAKHKGRSRLLKVSGNKVISWEQALDDFILLKKAEGKSERTLKDYGYHASNFFKCYPDLSLSNSVNLKSCIVKYLAEPAKTAYYNNKMVYLKIFQG